MIIVEKDKFRVFVLSAVVHCHHFSAPLSPQTSCLLDSLALCYAQYQKVFKFELCVCVCVCVHAGGVKEVAILFPGCSEWRL